MVVKLFCMYNDGLEKETATHSSILAWGIPWSEEPGGLLSMRSHRVGHDWSNLACMHALEKEMGTHSSVLAWRIPGTDESGGLLSMGSHTVGHDWSNLAAAAMMDICHYKFVKSHRMTTTKRGPEWKLWNLCDNNVSMLINCNKCTSWVGEADSREGCKRGTQRVYRNVVLSVQFCWEPKTVLLKVSMLSERSYTEMTRCCTNPFVQRKESYIDRKYREISNYLGLGGLGSDG